MPFYFTVLSSVAVSIDALVAGAAIGARCDRKNLQRTLFTVVAAVTALCAAAYLFARSVNRSFPPFSEKLGGPILMAIAFFEAVKKDKPSLPLRKRRVITFYEAFVTGVGIGVDGAFACVSAVLTGGGAETVACVAAFHLLFAEAGAFFSFSEPVKRAGDKFAPALLFLLGLFEFIK